jgi:hypothetical protein
MMRFGKIAACLAGGLALNAGLRAADPASPNSPSSPSPDNPYAAIAVRNIFSLIPPPPPEDPAKAAEKNLPKITPTGIMGVFGNWQVLFKVASTAAKPGQPAKDDYYILSEGQRQDDIEVIKIDEKGSIVTFKNHGMTQELPLANTPASGGAPSGTFSGGMNPGTTVPRPPGGGGNNGPGGFTQFGARPGGNNGGTPNSNPGFNGGAPNGANGANNGMNFGSSTQGRTYQPPQDMPQMTREEMNTLIEVQRAKYLEEGNPIANILPTTPLTKYNTTDGNTGK